VGRVLRPAARQHPDHIEIVEGQHGREHEVDDDHLAHRRDHHVDQPTPRGCAVDGRRLNLLAIDVLQRGEIDDRRERKALPDRRDDRRTHDGPGLGEPGLALARKADAD
jgi:hypothetical protein